MVKGKEIEEVPERGYAYTPGLKVKRVMKIVKVRRLPIAGETLVKVGDRVGYETIIAKTELPGEAVLVKASATLGVNEDEIRNFLFKNEGDHVSKDEVIGRYRFLFGLINREVTSSIDGQIETVSELTGQIIIRPKPIPLKVTAYIPGKVVSVLPKEGVVLETKAAFIQGIFGLGGENQGIVKVVTESPEDVLTADKITEDDEGCIVVGGSLITMDAYKKAKEVGVTGLVGGGMNYQDVTLVLGSQIGVAITGEEELGLTIIITEGFGRMTMSKRIFDLLKRFEGCMASVDGTTQIRAGVLRPEIIIPNKESLDQASGDERVTGLVPGRLVRIIREPYFGAISEVVRLPVELQEVETGSLVRVLVARLEDGRKVVVPRANVEIIEE